jgi:ribonuclease VapC
MTLVVDTSAVVALLTSEPGADELVDALDAADRRVMSAATLVEVGIVVEARFGPAGRGLVDRFVRDAEIEVVAVDRPTADLAVDGWRRYGKGRHAAGLNFGDCFAYALATDTGSAVLCTGDDFASADVEVVRPSRAARSGSE